MPKVMKSTHPPTTTRTLPYPVVTSTIMAPHTITTSMPRRPMTPPHTAIDHHASNTWNPEMDEQLMRARQQGLNWGPIAKRFFPDKTPNACRKRHERLMAQRNNAGDWDAAKMDSLAKAYLDVRQQMWSILADRMNGEKWQIVEAKCMEKGLKTLQTSGRTATRRERQTHPHSGSECDEDFYPSFREPSRSRQHSEDYTDSALGPDDHFNRSTEDPFSHPHHPPHQQRHSTQPSPINRTPPFPAPGRTFSQSSTLSSNFTPTLSTAPPFPSELSHSRPSPNQSSRMLPSFSSAFGGRMMPVTTVS